MLSYGTEKIPREGKHMSFRIPLPYVIVLLIGALLIQPVLAQRENEGIGIRVRTRDEAAIRDLLRLYEMSFNNRDIEARMLLCLDTYYEYGFEDGEFLQARDYDETEREVGQYWNSINSLDYSIDEVEITLDSPQAFVRAYTTHMAPDERHSSIVYFSLVKIDGQWRIAWDSYNIVRRYD
jgi:hypothetical protein